MEDVIRAMADFADGPALRLAIGLAAAGTISMAIIQIIKQLTPLRRFYNRFWLKRWIRLKTPLVDLPTAEKALAGTVTGGDRDACYELEADELANQLKDSITNLINYPHRNPEMYLLLSSGADKDDVDGIRDSAMRRAKQSIASAKVPTDQVDPEAAERPFPTDARGRVSERMRRNVDGMRYALNDDWRWWMQMLALVLTVVIVEGAIVAQDLASPGTMFVGIPLAIAGSYIAPITRDIVAALENLRGPRQG